jgi:FkbM family methyltransferase
MTNYQKMPLKTRIFDAWRNLFKLPVMENLLVKTGAGRKVNSIGYRLIPRVYSYAPGTWRAFDRNGVKMKLDISNFVDHALYFGIGDPGFEKLKRMVKPGWVILDIGANIGATVLRFAQLAPKGRVIGFEPNKKSFARLTENIGLNDRGNISVHNTGLGEKAEELRLFVVDETNPGMNRILNEPDATANALAFETIRVERLDDFIDIEKLERTDLVKIDVEGFEHNVLKGADRLLSSFRPLLFIEIDDDNLLQNKSSARELVSLLMNQGYQVFIADPWKPIDEKYDFSHCHFDILCVHNSRLAEVKL